MNIKIIYGVGGLIGFVIVGLIIFFISKKNISPQPAFPPLEPSTSRPPMPPMIYTSRPPMPVEPSTSRPPMPVEPSTSRRPEPVPANELEDAYYMSKKMNKDTKKIKEKLCKTLDAKKLFPDICN
jgi:hypothetical protein